MFIPVTFPPPWSYALTMKNSATDPASEAQPLFIPAAPRTWDSFFARIQSLFADEHAHVYIDTSFLMWLTKVGSQSRKELFDWFGDTLQGRLHVPIWTAHEYLTHHVKGTIVGDFAKLRNEIQSFAGRTYDQLRPFIDEPIGRHRRDPMTVRSDVRAALGTLNDLLEVAKSWNGNYEKHAQETIQFINALTPPNSSVYNDLRSVSSYADSRFRNTVPPGFKDLWKSRSQDHDSAASGNIYGDLLLWNEILNHACSVSATGIILITNDRKNDWRMGEHNSKHPEEPQLHKIRQSWKPIPRPHPMLVFEARTEANIQSLEVIDSVYLGAYLHIADVNAPAFVDVSLTPEPIDDGSTASTADADSPIAQADDLSPTEQSFPDAPNVHSTLSKLRSSLLSSRGSSLDSDSQRILDSWTRNQNGQFSKDDIYAGDPSIVNHKQLVAAARALHDGALKQAPGFSEILVDLADALDSFPPNTAAAVYFGFLASMYLDSARNNPRFPPRSPVAKRLFQLQHAHFSHHATTVLSRHLHRASERPIYVPSTEPRRIVFTFCTKPDQSPPGELSSMRMDTQEELTNTFPVELLSPIKTLDELHLGSLIGRENRVTPQQLIDRASEIYMFPTSSVDIAEPSEEDYAIPEALSFRDPRDIRIQEEPKNDAD